MSEPAVHVLRKDCFGATPKPARGTRALPGQTRTNQTERLFIQITPNSESRTCMAEAASPSSHSSFCEEVFSRCVQPGSVIPAAAVTDRGYRTGRMRWTGQIFWLLASGPAAAGRTFFPP